MTPRFVIIGPTFDHADQLELFLPTLDSLGRPVVIVDDGSRDRTRQLLETWRTARPESRRVVRHESNRGKAQALRTGFETAVGMGATHAACIDTDDQHDAGDLSRLMELSRHRPHAVILGARPRSIAGYPASNRLGRVLSNLLVRLESGVKVTDSQSGMRIYPLRETLSLNARCGRYCYETEIITLAGWAGLPVEETPIGCRYELPSGRVTHFLRWSDSWSSVRMHASLLFTSLLRIEPTPRIDITPDHATGTLLRRGLRWASLRRLRDMATGTARDRHAVAASVGIGMLMATLPLYGIKTVGCLWMAARFRLHPIVVLAISSLSSPPVGVIFIAASLATGHLLLRGHLPNPTIVDHWRRDGWSALVDVMAEMAAGSIVAGLTLGLLSYVVARSLLAFLSVVHRTTEPAD